MGSSTAGMRSSRKAMVAAVKAAVPASTLTGHPIDPGIQT